MWHSHIEALEVLCEHTVHDVFKHPRMCEGVSFQIGKEHFRENVLLVFNVE